MDNVTNLFHSLLISILLASDSCQVILDTYVINHHALECYLTLTNSSGNHAFDVYSTVI